MTLEAKGRIKFDPDVKPGEPHYLIESKQLGFIAPGSGNLEEMVQDITDRIERAIAEEFKVAPSAVVLTGYSMGLTFEVAGPVNRTLMEFQGDELDNKITINTPGHAPVETNLKQIKLVTKIMERAALTGETPEEVLAKLKKEAGKG